MYSIRLHKITHGFDESILEALEISEAEYNLLIDVVSQEKNLFSEVASIMVEAESPSRQKTIFYYKDRYSVINLGNPEVWTLVVNAIIDISILSKLPGVVGPSADAEQFAIEWSESKSCTYQLAMGQRLYELRRVLQPVGIKGYIRLMTESAVEIFTLWNYDYYLNALAFATFSTGQIRNNAMTRVHSEMTFFWEVEGQPVAMASLTSPTRNGIMIDAVYTPPDHRKHGYATALVAAVSEIGLKSGKQFCVLMTDVSNPTSNSMYEKVGFKPLQDFQHYKFDYTILVVRLYENVISFDIAVRESLEASEAENSLLIGMIEYIKKSNHQVAPIMVEVLSSAHEASNTAAFFNERNLILSRGTPEIWPLVSNSIKDIPLATKLPGVVGPSTDAEQFAITWSESTSCHYHLAMDQGLYELRSVMWPVGIKGSVRLITENDVELVSHWAHGFYKDALPWEMVSIELLRNNVINAIPLDMTFVWEVDGHPVAMASLARPTNNGVTINAVYTPPEHRRRGYATALVAAISEIGLKRGKQFCVLLTDLSNPTSNSIYQKVGFKQIGQFRNYRFDYR